MLQKSCWSGGHEDSLWTPKSTLGPETVLIDQKWFAVHVLLRGKASQEAPSWGTKPEKARVAAPYMISSLPPWNQFSTPKLWKAQLHDWSTMLGLCRSSSPCTSQSWWNARLSTVFLYHTCKEASQKVSSFPAKNFQWNDSIDSTVRTYT